MRIKSFLALLLALFLLSSCARLPDTITAPVGIGASSSPSAADGGQQIEAADVSPSTSPSPEASPSPSTSPTPSPSADSAPSPSPSSAPDNGYNLPEGLPTSIVNEDGSETPLYISSEDTDYMYRDGEGQSAVSPITGDFNDDGVEETLTLEVSHDFDELEDGQYNNPLTITMTIGDSSETFESTWNDGVYLYITDFNPNDTYLDIYYLEYITDTSSTFCIYRYDGNSLNRYQGFLIQGKQITYDSNGSIYFRSFEWGLLDHNEDHQVLTYSYDYINNTFEIYSP